MNTSIRLAGLWEKKDPEGNSVFSGSLNSISELIVIPNNFKKEETDPDYFLCIQSKNTKRLGEMLLDAGEISNEQLQEALTFKKENGGLLGNILIGLGYITTDTLENRIKEQFDESQWSP
jgi:hypothetical protein